MKYLPVFLLILCAPFTRCARQTTPTGGPRDTIPPTLIQSIPPNQTTGYQGQRIQLIFDEDIAINNPREQLLITPTIGTDFEMTVRRKTVYLDLNSELQDSTTYTINFRESIQDNTEKNPALNLQLALSTGPYLDSLFISGNVYDLLKATPLENASVALYKDADTFNIFEHKPEYLTLTDKNGNFLFQNLKAGQYYIYAFEDENRNITVDSRSEKYGFLAAAIDLTPGAEPYVQIPIIALDARELRLMSARPYNTYFNIRTSKNLSAYELLPVEPSDSSRYFHTYGPDHANIQVYLPQLNTDSLALHFTASDSMGYQLDTVFYAKLAPRAAQPEAFKITPRDTRIYPETSIFTSTISANKPLRALTYDSIVYVLDSAITIPLSADNITFSEQTLVKIHSAFPSEYFQPATAEPVTDDFRTSGSTKSKSQINKLRLGKGAFISIENDSSQATEIPATLIRTDNTGIILATVQTDEESYITQLLNKDYSLNQAVPNQSSIAFRNLPPGDYMLALVIDRNNNGQWDPGNFHRKEEPEPIVFYRASDGNPTVAIKANWELGPMLITYPQPVDNPGIIPQR